MTGAKVEDLVNAIVRLRAKLGSGREGLLVTSGDKAGIVSSQKLATSYAMKSFSLHALSLRHLPAPDTDCVRTYISVWLNEHQRDCP